MDQLGVGLQNGLYQLKSEGQWTSWPVSFRRPFRQSLPLKEPVQVQRSPEMQTIRDAIALRKLGQSFSGDLTGRFPLDGHEKFCILSSFQWVIFIIRLLKGVNGSRGRLLYRRIVRTRWPGKKRTTMEAHGAGS